jgi:preprotein translocase subunit SecE
MNNEKKSKAAVYICIAIFGILGVYLTFFAGNTSKYDAKTNAYQIDKNERYDSDDGTMYSPIYHFRHNGNNYECKSKMSSSSYPKESKNTVYYDSNNPEKCMTEYEKSNGLFAGIICLVVAAVVFFFFIKKNRSETENEQYHEQNMNNTEALTPEQQQQLEENAQKVINVIEKASLIYKRIVLGFIIVVLIIFILIDTALYKQTKKAEGYTETTATYVEKKEDGGDSIFDDYIYTFKDKKGNDQQITVSVSKESIPEEQITIKYDENNPQEFFEEGATLDKTDMTWYIVKIVALVLLVFLFFNKRLLNKIGISGAIRRQ